MTVLSQMTSIDDILVDLTSHDSAVSDVLNW